jgi:hypothetical protein
MTDDALQFDKVEYDRPAAAAGAGPSCGFCRAPILTEYWAVADRTACARCHGLVLAQLEGDGPAEWVKATIFGLLAAIVGAVLWVVIIVVTKLMLSIVAIVVAVGIATAVRKGSGNRGGPVYQVLATGLTYAAIAGSMAPFEFLRAVADHRPASVGGAIVASVVQPFVDKDMLGLVIIGIGLHQAWRMTSRVKVPMSGPHAVGPAPAVSPALPPPGAPLA